MLKSKTSSKRKSKQAVFSLCGKCFKLAFEDADGIQDLLETYDDEEFQGDEARRSWDSVMLTGKESLSKLTCSVS